MEKNCNAERKSVQNPQDVNLLYNILKTLKSLAVIYMVCTPTSHCIQKKLRISSWKTNRV